MDQDRFDRIAKSLAAPGSRRRVLGGLLGAALGLTGLVREEVAAACLENGVRCGAGRGRCCSGRCKLKAGTRRKFCKAAPNQGICTIETNTCDSSSGTRHCSPSMDCICYVTPTGRSFCGSNTCFVQNCSSNADCVKDHGEGAICWTAGTGCCGGDKGCIPACSDPT